MKLISFDPFRSTGIPDTTYLKPELLFKNSDLIKECDWVLFPEYWQVNLLHYGWKKRIFPSINTYHLGHDKVEMTRILQAIVPQHIPYTYITSSKPGVEDDILEQFGFPFVAKEIRNSMGKGVHLINNRKELFSYIEKNEILYIQEYLPVDRDIRLVYVGDKVVFSYWRIGNDSFKNNVAQGGIIDYSPVPQEAVALVETVAKELGINHAGFDVAILEGHPYFFEFNVMFGNQALLNQGLDLSNHILEYIRK